MRKLVIMFFVAGALVFAATGITAAVKDDLLKDEKHFYDESSGSPSAPERMSRSRPLTSS